MANSPNRENLWNLKFTGNEFLPTLRPGGDFKSGDSSNLNKLLQTKVYGTDSPVAKPIDVNNDFPWTVNPKSSRRDVPVIQLTEHRILYNSIVSNLVYSVEAAADSGYAIANLAGDALAGAGDAIGGLFQTGEQSAEDTGSAEAEDQQTQEGLLAKAKRELSTGYDKLAQAGGYRRLPQALKPYQGLYATEPTGFNYYFPYLTDAAYEVNTSFGEGEGNVLKPITDLAAGAAAGLAGIANLLKPGTYIEKSQQFTMGQTGRTLNFKIPLLNTLDDKDISTNWQLIFGLIYQNRPGRVSKSIIDQPVLYEVNLPGVAHMPYAYISRLAVNFLGARRLMNLEVPVSDEEGNDIGTITTTVPDAYELDITVTGLNEETRNMLYANITKSKLTVNAAVEPGETPISGVVSRVTSALDSIFG